MFINKKVNYGFKPIKSTYNKVCEVLEWQKDLPNLEQVDKKYVNYISAKWKYVKVKKNFQELINSEYLITPEMIYKNNIVLPNQKVNYGDMTQINNNANDLRKNANKVVNEYINNKSKELAENDIKKQLDELNKKINDINLNSNKNNESEKVK